jgi:hypothetical protein
VTRVERGTTVEHRDPRDYARWIGALVLAPMLLLLMPYMFMDVWSFVFAAAMIVFGFWGIWRAWNVGSIRIDARGITELAVFRNFRWAWDELDRASVEVVIPRMKVVECRTLVIRPKFGTPHYAWYTLASPKEGESSWVDVAAREINERIATEAASANHSGVASEQHSSEGRAGD